MPSGRMCLGCGALVVGMVAERCDPCATRDAEDRERRRKALHGKGGRKRDTARSRARAAIYRSPQWKVARARAIQRDGACMLCGDTRQLSVHHTIPVLDDPARAFDIAYLVTLCRKCHGRVDGGRAHSPRSRATLRTPHDEAG